MLHGLAIKFGQTAASFAKFARNNLSLTQIIPKRTSLNTKRTCDDEEEDDDEDNDDDDDDDERYRYDQRVKMFKFQSKTLSSTFNFIDILLKNPCQCFSHLKNH